MKTIYDLELHEGLMTDFGIFIMRVPSGWIYDCWDIEKDCFKHGIFVPFDNKFQLKQPTTEQKPKDFSKSCQCKGDMENLRKELIDFQRYLRLPGVDNMRSDEVRADNFISINSDAQAESPNVGDNEAKKEFTQKLLNKIHDIDPEYVYLVNNEFWNLFE
jgi:hypothetical protein